MLEARRPERDWIAAHIPHQGRMCLLERVLAWDAQRIVCAASSHRGLEHPLREHGRLAACHAIEYAAQAMAVHGVLRSPTRQPLGVGYLASVRGVRLYVERLDDIAADLQVEAARLSGDDALIVYRFAVGAAGRCLVEGRAAVVLDAKAAPPAP